MTYPDGRLQRAVGRAQLGVRRSGPGTAIDTLHQSGCLNLRFPRSHGGGLEAVLINLSGGVADGDALAVSVEVGASSALTLSTPSAERIYRGRAEAAAARIDVRARIGAGSRLDYLPQETLFFEGAALDRTLDIALDPAGVFLGVEAKIFGREHSGEAVTTLRVRDRISLRRGGRLILQDIVRLQGNVQAILAAPAGAGGGTAAATLVYAAPDAEACLDPVRAALESSDAGASAWDGMLVARLVAKNGQALREALLPALKILVGKALPRLWAS